MGLRGVLAFAPFVVFDVFLIVALEPCDLRVAFEGEDVRGNAVEKPSIVGYDHRAARERHQRLLQRPQGFDVEVIGGLVEQQDVAPGFQHLRKVHAIAFASRQIADELLLLRALEVEAADIASRGGLVVAHLDDIESAGDFLPHGVLVVERLARLIDIGKFDRGTHPDVAAVGFVHAGQHPEQRGLAGSIRSDDAHDPAGREAKA